VVEDAKYATIVIEPNHCIKAVRLSGRSHPRQRADPMAIPTIAAAKIARGFLIGQFAISIYTLP